MTNYPKIMSRKIKYDSPSGFVHIGKYIPPFEKVNVGFGFKGVMVEDFESGNVQCHICGKWYQNLSTHVSLFHKLTTSDYKRNFGLLQSTALRTKKMRLKQSEVMIRLREKNPQNRSSFLKNNSFAGNRKGIKKANEHQNKFGVCDLQILEKVKEMAEELGKTPTLIDLRERYGFGFVAVMHQRYGSYINYCKKNGFIPNISNFNPKYDKEYFITKIKDQEPTIRIFTKNEARALYRFFKGGIKELKQEAIRTQNVK